MMRKKLTDEQYADFKTSVVDDAVQDILGKFVLSIEGKLFETLRNNRVGEDRANRIMQQFAESIKDV